MTNIKHITDLDKVLENYAQASQEFDAKVLMSFIEKYPEHASALQRYAQIQLTSVPASLEEIENEPLSDEEMLPRQSRLLQRMQQLRGNSSTSDHVSVANKLASISGEKAMLAATVAVFGSYDHGEDLLLLSVIDATSEVSNVPDWFYTKLGTYIQVDPASLRASNEAEWKQVSGQRFSAKEKPTASPPITWKEAVENCILDDSVRKEILERF